MPCTFTQISTIGVLLAASQVAYAQSTWKLDLRSSAGPIAQVTLSDVGSKRRASFVAFEYSRNCDPIFSITEITGNKFGKPVSQSLLRGTKIGVIVNGKFHTWHAAITNYDNGYEAGFGITKDLYDLLTNNIHSIIYVTPDGENVSLPLSGFHKAVQSAFQACVNNLK